jgi:hypothetical protein
MYITSLTVRDGELPRPTLEACLEKFPGITTLYLETGSVPAWPTLLTLSESLSQLTAVNIDVRLCDPVAESVHPDTARTALTTFLQHYSKLKCVSLSNKAVSLHFSDVVRSCPRLCKMECILPHSFIPPLNTRESWLPILQLTALQDLTVGLRDSKSLLPLLREMQQLRSLSGFLINDIDGFRFLAALTQLTRVSLEVEDWTGAIPRKEGLGPLTGLVKLNLETHGSVAGLGGVVSAMPGLAELRLEFSGGRGLAWDFATFWANAQFNNLTALHLRPDYGLSLCRLVGPFFSQLRSLSLSNVPHEVGPNLGSLVAYLTRIQDLDLTLEEFEVVPHLSTLTGLTRLAVPVQHIRTSGLPTFLSTLVRLGSLHLSWYLDLNDKIMEQFMCCFTMLHDLESLHLILLPPAPGCPLDGNSSVLGWQQLRPLLGLRLLEVFQLTEPWTIPQEVVDSWQQLRQEMGLRPLRRDLWDPLQMLDRCWQENQTGYSSEVTITSLLRDT